MSMPMGPQNPREAMGQRWDENMGGKANPQDVNYRQAEDPRQSCGKCVSFNPPNACDVVAGKINAGATCDQFQGQENAGPGQPGPMPEGGILQ